MTEFAYIRVSTKDQNENRQIDALEAAGIENAKLFIDKSSGKDFNRQQYKKMLKRMRLGDVLYVKSIDRLGRNYEEIIEQWRILTKDKGIDIVVLDMPLLDTRKDKNLMGTFIADLVLQILSFVAETERANIKQRQAEGIAAAKARGVKFGRPKKEMPDNFGELATMWFNGQITGSEAARKCGVALSTFRNRAERLI